MSKKDGLFLMTALMWAFNLIVLPVLLEIWLPSGADLLTVGMLGCSVWVGLLAGLVFGRAIGELKEPTNEVQHGQEVD